MELTNFFHGQRVVAKRTINDSPLAKKDASAKAGEVGWIDDIDYADGYLLVSFSGREAILCSVDEVK